MRKADSLLIIMMFCFSHGYATIVHVPTEVLTIQAGIDTTTNGDTVLVQPGTYTENINFNGKNITLRSTGGPEVTIIDGNQMGSCVFIASGENENAVMDGFTLTNGTGSFSGIAYVGGGIAVINNSSPTLTNLIITGNSSTIGSAPSGGGINIGVNSTPYLEGIVVTNNTSVWGGGISIYDCSPVMQNVVISNNHATTGGGGLYIGVDAAPEIRSVEISDNTAESFAGGIFVSDNSSPLLNEVTVVGNRCPAYGGGLTIIDNCNPVITNSIFWDNAPSQIYLFDSNVFLPSTLTVSYSDIMNGSGGIELGNGTLFWLEGNLNADPWFCEPEASIFTLAEDSPCLGTGENGIDMGAYGLGCTTPVALDDDPTLPEQLTLHQNYPNPFNPSTTINFDLPGAGWVKLVVYDVLGRQVATLLDAEQNAGYQSIFWNAMDEQGKSLEAGVYLYQLHYVNNNGSEFRSVKKFSLIK